MTTKSSSIDIDFGRFSQTEVYRIIDDLTDDCHRERRIPKRIPIVASVDIETSNGIIIPAKIRDSSRTGLGLAHHSKIPCRNVVLYLGSRQVRKKYSFKVDWCRKIDDDTYVSGGHFLWGLDPQLPSTESAARRLYRAFFGSDGS